MINIYKRMLLLMIITTLVFTNSAKALTSDTLNEFTLRSQGIYYHDPNGVSDDCGNTATMSGSPIDMYLKALAKQESNGDPRALNFAYPNLSDASGKFQYISTTWASKVKSYYDPTILSLYPESYMAPEEIQDAVVYLEYTALGNDIGFDVFKFAINHFYPLANSDTSYLDVIIPPNPITPRQYADGVVTKIQNGLGADIQLNYSKAPNFSSYLSKLTTATTATSAVVGANRCPNGVNGSALQIAEAEFAKRFDLTTGKRLPDFKAPTDGSKSTETLESYANRIHETEGPNCGWGIGKYWVGTDDDNNKGPCGTDYAWCAAFVSWVFYKSGSPFKDGLQDGGWSQVGVGNMANELRLKHKYTTSQARTFEPLPGDIVIMGGRGADTDSSGYEAHVGIVQRVEGSTIITIEGNSGDSISSHTYDYVTSNYINGWGRF